MFHSEMRFVDKDGTDVPTGEVGEIISVQDPLGMIGYHKKEKDHPGDHSERLDIHRRSGKG